MAFATNHRFVTAWQASTSTAEVAKKLGISAAVAMNRASRLRLQGVNLKYFRGKPEKADVSELNKLCQ